MEPKSVLAVFLIISLALFGCLQNHPGTVNSNYATPSYTITGAAHHNGTVSDSLYGQIRGIYVANSPSGVDHTFEIVRPDGSILFSTQLAAGASYTNYSMAVNVSSRVNLTMVDNFTGNVNYTSAGLIAAYHMDEGSGVNASDSVNSSAPNMSVNSWLQTGRVNNGTYCDGTYHDAIINSSAVDLSNLQNFTIAFWASPAGGNNQSFLFSKGPASKPLQKAAFAQISYDGGNETVTFTVNQYNSTVGASTNSTALAGAGTLTHNVSAKAAFSPDYNATVLITYTQKTANFTAYNSTPRMFPYNSTSNLSTNTSTLFLSSSYLSTYNTNATLTVRYGMANVTVNVSVDGTVVGTLSYGNTSKNFSVNQTILAAATNVTFDSNDSGSTPAIWNVSLSYRANDTTTVTIGAYKANLTGSGSDSFSVPQGNLSAPTLLVFTTDATYNYTNVTNTTINCTLETPVSATYVVQNSTFTGVWHHFAFTYNYSTNLTNTTSPTYNASIYIDGAFVNSTTGANGTMVPSSGGFKLGDNGYVGGMDELYIYNSSLNRSQIGYLNSDNHQNWIGQIMITLFKAS